MAKNNSLASQLQAAKKKLKKVSSLPSQTKTRSRNRSRKTKRNSVLAPIGLANPYLESLYDPEIYPGAKVPDLCAFPTGTFQLTFDGTLATPAAPGDSVGAFITPGIASNPMSTMINSVANGALTVTGFAWSSRSAIQAVYGLARPVSCEIYAEFIGSTMNDNGMIIAFLLPRGTTPTNTVTTPGNIAAYPYTRTYPLREGARIVWKPMDNADFEFTPTGTVTTAPTIGFLVNGATASTTVVKLRVVCNFEGIPLTDQSTLVNAAPSPVNLDLLQKAMNLGSQIYNSFSPFVHSVPNLAGTMVNSVLPSALNIGTQFAQRAVLNAASNRFSTLGNARVGF